MPRKPRNEVWWQPAILLVLVLASLAGGQAEEVILHLKNGDRLTGKVITESTNSVTLATRFLGEVQIPVNEITNREVVLIGTNSVAPALPAATNQTTSVPAPKVAQAKPPLSPANPEATPIASTPNFWKHDVRFGLNMRYAEKDSQEFLLIE